MLQRPNLNDAITSGRITFSDGSTQQVDALINSGNATVVNFDQSKNITSLQFEVLSVRYSTGSAGLAEIQCFADSVDVEDLAETSSSGFNNDGTVKMLQIPAGNVNLALNATAYASSAGGSQPAKNAIDRVASGSVYLLQCVLSS